MKEQDFDSVKYIFNVLNSWTAFCKDHRLFIKALNDILVENQNLKEKNKDLVRQNIVLKTMNNYLSSGIKDDTDVVEVVRCKDCKFCIDEGMSGLYCEHPDGRNTIHCRADDFCNDGERR